MCGLVFEFAAVLCEILGALCGYSERLGETAEDQTEGHAEQRREELKLALLWSRHLYPGLQASDTIRRRELPSLPSGTLIKSDCVLIMRFFI